VWSQEADAPVLASIAECETGNKLAALDLPVQYEARRCQKVAVPVSLPDSGRFWAIYSDLADKIDKLSVVRTSFQFNT
jgi:hypothetical protein